MSQRWANNVSTVLASPITSSATSLTVQSGTGALFPSLTTPDFFIATLISAANPNNFEIILCSARSGDTFGTIVRAQEGTTAQNFAAGDTVALLPTAAGMASLTSLTSLPTSTGTANAQVITNTNPVQDSQNGLRGTYQVFLPGFTNTGAMTLAIDSTGTRAVVYNGEALTGGEITAGVPAIVYETSSGWNLVNPYVGHAPLYPGLPTAGGTANALTIANAVPFTVLKSGLFQVFVPASPNTGATTVNIDSLGVETLLFKGQALNGGELQAGVPAILCFDGTNMNLLTSYQSENPLVIGLPTATGTANALVLANTIAVTVLKAGMFQVFLPASSNTGSATINIDGTGATTIRYNNQVLTGGELNPLVPAILVFNPGHGFSLINPYVDTAPQQVSVPTAGGTANALTVANTQPFGVLEKGQMQALVPASTNTGATTLNVDGLGAVAVHNDGSALVGNELQTGVPAIVLYDGTVYNLVAKATKASEFTFFTSNGNFTPKATAQYVVFAIGGGGGGGGGCATTTAATSGDGGGGGSGGLFSQETFSLTAGTAYAVVIGVGGSSGSAGTSSGPGGAGGSGGNTTFNGVTVGTGGVGGLGGRRCIANITSLANGGQGTNGGGNLGGQGGVGATSTGNGGTGGSASANTGAGGGGGGGGLNTASSAENGGAGGTGGSGMLWVYRI